MKVLQCLLVRQWVIVSVALPEQVPEQVLGPWYNPGTALVQHWYSTGIILVQRSLARAWAWIPRM